MDDPYDGIDGPPRCDIQSDDLDYKPVPGKHVGTFEMAPKGTIKQLEDEVKELKTENEKLLTALRFACEDAVGGSYPDITNLDAYIASLLGKDK